MKNGVKVQRVPSSTEVKNLKIIRRFAPYIIFMPLTYGTSLQSGVLNLSTPRYLEKGNNKLAFPI